MRRRLSAAAGVAALTVAAGIGGCGSTTVARGGPPGTPARPGPGLVAVPVVSGTAGLSPLPWSDPVAAGGAVVVRTSWGGCAGPPVAATVRPVAGGVQLGVWDRRSTGQVCADFVVAGQVLVRLPAGLSGRPLLGSGSMPAGGASAPAGG